MRRGRDGEEILEPDEEETFQRVHGSLFPEIEPRQYEPPPCNLCGGSKLLWRKRGKDDLIAFDCPECRALDLDATT